MITDKTLFEFIENVQETMCEATGKFYRQDDILHMSFEEFAEVAIDAGLIIARTKANNVAEFVKVLKNDSPA